MILASKEPKFVQRDRYKPQQCLQLKRAHSEAHRHSQHGSSTSWRDRRPPPPAPPTARQSCVKEEDAGFLHPGCSCLDFVCETIKENKVDYSHDLIHNPVSFYADKLGLKRETDIDWRIIFRSGIIPIRLKQLLEDFTETDNQKMIDCVDCSFNPWNYRRLTACYTDAYRIIRKFPPLLKNSSHSDE